MTGLSEITLSSRRTKLEFQQPDSELLSILERLNRIEDISDIAKANARHLITKMRYAFPQHFNIWSIEDDGVAIEPVSPDDDRVMRIECDADGGVLCIASMGDNLRRAKYYQIDGLPDGFLFEALLDLYTPSVNMDFVTWSKKALAHMKDYGAVYFQVRTLNTPQEETLIVRSDVSTHQPESAKYRWID